VCALSRTLNHFVSDGHELAYDMPQHNTGTLAVWMLLQNSCMQQRPWLLTGTCMCGQTQFGFDALRVTVRFRCTEGKGVCFVCFDALLGRSWGSLVAVV
jgi:hypothetical protein